MSSTKIAMAQPHSFQSGAFSFMSCTSGREGSPLDETTSHQPTDFKAETKKKRFHPLRNLRRMFRRKSRRSSISTDSYQPGVPDNPEINSTNLEQRSCSTSRLQEENLTQNLIRNSRLNPGLSLSHDSIFTPDRADSGLSSSDLENSSLSITVLTTPSKSFPIKSQSSCSETSLLSIGSSEAELSPIRSGKLSDLDLGVTAYKLSHSAAKHKMAVKPRRNHGAPRHRRRPMVSTSLLPTTVETGEEGLTDRKSPQQTPDISLSPSPSKSEKCSSETKISWSQLSAESSAKEPEEKFEKSEDESDARKEELTNQKTESFFGRFLSRRSDKKKKQVSEINVDEEKEEEEKHHYVKKISKPLEGKGRVTKSPNRRQRVEPGETSCNLNANTVDPERRKPSSPVSAPKSYWSSPLTSRSKSPPKVIWPDTWSQIKSPELEVAVRDKPKTDFSELPENLNLKNSDFVKELTNCVSSLSKEVAGKRKLDEEDREAILKIQRQHSEEATPQKLTTAENALGSRNKSVSSESITNLKSSDEQTNVKDCAYTNKNACDFDLRTFHASFEAIHDGYENIQIIELVKEEVKNSDGQPSGDDSIKLEKAIEMESTNEENFTEKQEKEPELSGKKVKPVVSEKPRDLKRTVGQDFLKLSVSRGPLCLEDSEAAGQGKATPRAKATLVERRKSELLSLTETEDKEWKAKMKSLKKQTSFSETTGERGEAEDAKKILSSPEKTESSREIVDEVVLRKKSASVSDEQPELMKVFARRSLKVRESEKLAEEVHKARDSDKENEMVESPIEDRKKGVSDEKKREGESLSEENPVGVKERATDEVVISMPVLKPEIASRKNLIPRYGRSLSENNAKCKEEPTVLEENKWNNLRSLTSAGVLESTEKGEDEKKEETGFKRIQQRKAEWERRAQQGAK